jgi:nucleotide-binding universal stress UspA family protein
MRALVATDGSECAALAIDLVAQIDWPAGTAIRVVEAIETGAALFGGPWPAVAMVHADELEADVLRIAHETVSAARARIARPGLAVDTAVLRGRPASAIVDAATAMAADVIVVGSRGHGTIESMVLGSVSAEVIDRAHVPVLVARGGALGPVLLAWDGSAGARAAADLVLKWPIVAALPVRVTSVTDVELPWWTGFPEPGAPGAIPLYLESVEQTRRTHEEIARELVAELESAGLSATVELRDGDAATEIIAAARETGAGLIVMGTHGRTGVSRLVLGSVARNVVQHAPCSVLVVRESPTEGRPR